MTDPRRGTRTGPFAGQPPHEREATDPGSYIGRRPERVEESIPGGLSHKDERASATASQPGPITPDRPTPDGHREGQPATGDDVREAGQDR
jgi:hypothetical protein